MCIFFYGTHPFQKITRKLVNKVMSTTHVFDTEQTKSFTSLEHLPIEQRCEVLSHLSNLVVSHHTPTPEAFARKLVDLPENLKDAFIDAFLEWLS